MKLLVIDGNSIVNRAYYGMHPLNNQEGFPTHAIYGFLNILRRIREEVDPDGVCVAFDRKEPTFRHLAYPDYKAQRKGMPEKLAVQMPVLKQVLDAMNIPRYELAGWEADDLIGTIAKTCEEAGWDCRVATGDKDSLQLVTDRTYIELVTTRMGKTTTKEMDPAAFQETYGFGPLQMVDLKALIAEEFPGMPVAVCANLPYYITSPILMKLLEEGCGAESITVMVQKEAAQRIAAKPGTRDCGALTAAIHYYSEPEKLFDVGKNSFVPAPKVDSSVIRLKIRKEPPVSVPDEKYFFKVIRASFGQRRKTLANSVSGGLGLTKDEVLCALERCGLSPTARAEELSLEDFAAFSAALAKIPQNRT